MTAVALPAAAAAIVAAAVEGVPNGNHSVQVVSVEARAILP